MDRNTALSALIDLRQICIEEGRPKIAEAVGVAIEALQGDLHCPKCGTIVRDGRQYHDLVYRGEAEKLQLSGETSTCKVKKDHDFLIREGEKVSKEQKSELDLISRQDAIAYIDRIINSGLGKNKSLDYIRKYISALPSAETHEIRTETHGVCSDCISREQAIEAIADIEVINHDQLNIREGAVFMLEQLPPVTPTERTGEWAVAYLDHESVGVRPRTLNCSECNWLTSFPSAWCPNCGAKMGEIDNE